MTDISKVGWVTDRFLNPVREMRLSTREDQVRFLFALGHMQHVCEGMTRESLAKVEKCTDAEFAEGVKSLQRYSPSEVKVDGRFGPITRNAQRTRICACPDIMDVTANRRRWSDAAKRSLTYWLSGNFGQGVSMVESEKQLQLAADRWNATADVRLQKVLDQSANNRVWPMRLDGPGRVLADQILPNHDEPLSTTLRMRVDTAERWARDLSFLGAVLTHELGHFFGYGHSNRTSSILYPYANGVTELDTRDIELHQATYGKPSVDDGGGELTIVISGDIRPGKYRLERI